MGPTSNDWCPYKGKEIWRDPETHREEGRVMTEAEFGKMQVEAEACQGLLNHQKLEEAGTHSSLEPPEGT